MTAPPIDDGWKPGRWWRVIYADRRRYVAGSLAGHLQVWCETSDEEQAREHLQRCPGGGILQRMHERHESEWREVGP